MTSKKGAYFSGIISQYHPDKVQHLGREFQQMAEYKTKEIQKAYDYFKQNYNINN
jgi:DnaJ-domain-containing protein 1